MSIRVTIWEVVKFISVGTVLIIGALWSYDGRFPIDLPLIGYSSRDPNLQMTFSCHGDRRIENFNGEGKPDIINEKVSHSITFWRWKQEKSKDGETRWNKYKVNRFVIDSDFQNLTDHEFLTKDVLETAEDVNYFRVRTEQFGIFKFHYVRDKGHIQRDEGLSEQYDLEFNFITKTLEFNEVNRDGKTVWQKVYDKTRCEKVTDPNILQEMSVIRS